MEWMQFWPPLESALAKGYNLLVQIRAQGYGPVHGSFKTKKEATGIVRKMEGDMGKYSILLAQLLSNIRLKIQLTRL